MNGSSFRWSFLPVALLLALLAWNSIGSASRTQPRFDQTPLDGTHRLAAEAETLRIDLKAGGKLAASDLQLGEDCRGYISRRSANVRVQFEQSENASVELELRGQQPNALIVNGPGGQWHCARSERDHTSTLRLDAATSGQIDIWAASFRGSRQDTVTLSVRAVTN